MEKKDRITYRNIVEYYVPERYNYPAHTSKGYFYLTNELDVVKIYRRLGFYEDIGYSPLELLEIVIRDESRKGIYNWDIEKMKNWEELKSVFKQYECE